MQVGRFRATIVNGDPDQQVLRIALGVLDEDIEVAVRIKNPRIEKLVFKVVATPAPVRFYQIAIGKFLLRILVEVLHVRVCGSAINIKVVLLHIFAVIALAIRQTEQALFEDRVAAVPKSYGEAELLLIVRDACQSVFSPTIGARARLVVTEVVPGISVVTIVL